MRVWFAVAALALIVSRPLTSQRPEALIRQELQQAEKDIPQLIDALTLGPTSIVADIGAGGGAMVQVLARTLGPRSRVYATDITESALTEIRQKTEAAHLTNVVVVEGTADSAMLSNECCDAIYTRNVYHHFTNPEAMNRSLYAALKPGGLFAVIDFEARPGSTLPAGVPANRGGNGIRPGLVVEEVPKAGFEHVRTIDDWPTPDSGYFLLLFRKP